MDKIIKLYTFVYKRSLLKFQYPPWCIFSANRSNSTCKALLSKPTSSNVNYCNYSVNSNLTEEFDDNDKAMQELDITLLKPHPEWRNVVTGPVWGKGDEYYELLWKHWLDDPFIKRYKLKQDEDWDEYLAKFGASPIEYMISEEYIEKYQDKFVWFGYTRNKKGYIQRQKTRKSCKVNDVVASGSPCALCRDDQLLLTYKNVPLLTHFIDSLTGELHNCLRTGLCRKQQQNLVKSFNLAQELGYFYRIVPFVKYDLKSYKRNSPAL